MRELVSLRNPPLLRSESQRLIEYANVGNLGEATNIRGGSQNLKPWDQLREIEPAACQKEVFVMPEISELDWRGHEVSELASREWLRDE